MPRRRDQLPDLWRMTLSAWTLALQGDQDRLSALTIEKYLWAASEWILWCEAQSLDPLEVTKTHLRGWIAAQREAGVAASTIDGRLAGTRRLYRWLVSEGDVTVSPCDGIGKITVPEPETPVMGTADIERLLKVCSGSSFADRRDNAMLRLLFDTGIRRAECAGITLADLDVVGKQIIVRGKGKPGMGPHIRIVPFNVKCGVTLTRYLRMRCQHRNAKTPYLWLSQSDSPPTGQLVRKICERRAKEAGVTFHPHWARHRRAHDLKSAGVSDQDLDILMGWRDPRTKRRYGAALATERAIEAGRRVTLDL